MTDSEIQVHAVVHCWTLELNLLFVVIVFCCFGIVVVVVVVFVVVAMFNHVVVSQS